MEDISRIGVSTQRKESWDKVTGADKYNGESNLCRCTGYEEIKTAISSILKDEVK